MTFPSDRNFDAVRERRRRRERAIRLASSIGGGFTGVAIAQAARTLLPGGFPLSTDSVEAGRIVLALALAAVCLIVAASLAATGDEGIQRVLQRNSTVALAATAPLTGLFAAVSLLRDDALSPWLTISAAYIPAVIALLASIPGHEPEED